MIENGTPIRARRMAPAGRALALITAFALGCADGGPAPQPARAQEQATRGLPIIRDTEIEQLMRDYASPILKAAGLAKQNVKVVILNDRAFNASVIAGARSGNGGPGVGAIMAPQGAIQRSLLAYVRTQEDQADHAGVKFLTATGQSARGMLDLFKRLSNEALFNSRYIDPYLQTHPLPPERVAALEVLARAS